MINIKVSSPELDSGFFAAALEAGNIVAMSCGHDHNNDYCGSYSGIHLCKLILISIYII